MTLHRPYPSIGDYIETIANPSGRFATLRDLLPVTDPTGLPVYVCGTGRVTFRVTLNGHAHDLTCFTTPAALRNAHRYGQLLPDEAFVFGEDSAGAFYPVVLRAVETPTDTDSSTIEPENTPATENSSIDVPVSVEPDSAGELCEGLRVVVRGDFFGYADTEGHLVIEPQYVWAGDFGEGRAAVAVAAPGDEQGTLMGLIDREGRQVIAPIYDDLSWDGSRFAYVERDGRYGCLDRMGHTIVPLQYDWMGEFDYGYALIRRSDGWGYVSEQGEEATPGAMYADARSVSADGTAQVLPAGSDTWETIRLPKIKS